MEKKKAFVYKSPAQEGGDKRRTLAHLQGIQKPEYSLTLRITLFGRTFDGGGAEFDTERKRINGIGAV